MSRLALALLGPFQITLDGKPVTAPLWAKTQALLAYLALQASAPHRRDVLAGLLWPDQPEEAARHSLRQAIHQLCRALGDAAPPFLLITPQTVQFNLSSEHTLDVAEFTALIRECDKHSHRRRQVCRACAVRLQHATALYRGDLLAGFYLKDSAAFEEWALVKREQLARMALGALHSLAEHHALRGEYQDMEQAARRQIEIDPFHEGAHRQLMYALARSGQRNTALERYETLRRMLAQELGVTPDEETTRLRAQIESGALGSQAPPPLRNWPVRLTSFVGRDQELAQLAEWLQSPDVRLMTLVGPGGIGKTRLALQAAELEAWTFRNGACWVPLAQVSGPEFIVPAILHALGISLVESPDPRAQFVRYLRETKQDLLVVLDSMEHLVTGSALIADMLRACPTLKILVTSREGLEIEGEWQLPVQGLALPTQDSPANLEAYSAAQLFLQRAQQARPGWALSATDRPIVARICRLVGGMPLGLELAAAWVKTISYADIACEIERGLDLLASTLRDAPERHRSVRAAFEHSWNLLTGEEQRVFRQLAVFRGGFHRQAAEAVIGECWSAVANQLVDKSLLQLTPAGRYEQHPLIHQYAQEKLVQAPDEEGKAQEQHGRYYIEFIREQGGYLKGPQQMQALAKIRNEMENVRAAWQWAIAGKRVTEIGRGVEGLGIFYRLQGWYQEGAASLGNAAAALDGCEMWQADTAAAAFVLGMVLMFQGLCCNHLGQLERARITLERSVALLRPTGKNREIALALAGLGWTVRGQGEYLQAWQIAQESLAQAWLGRDPWSMAMVNMTAGFCAQLVDLSSSARCLETSVAILRDLGDISMLATALSFLGDTFRLSARPAEARLCLEESLTFAQKAGFRQLQSWSLTSLGEVSYMQEDYAEAQRCFEQGLVIIRDISNGWSMGHVFRRLGDVACALGNYAEAREHLRAAFETAVKLQAWSRFLEALVGWARLLTKQDSTEQEQAVELLTLALKHPMTCQEDRTLAECLLCGLRGRLPQSAFDAATQRGQARTLETVVKETLRNELASL